MICCFDIGGTYIRCGMFSGGEEVPEAGRFATPRDDFEAFVGAMREGIAGMNADRSVAVSMALAGTFDRHSGNAAIANIPCLNGRKLESELAARLGRPVRVSNDADCFALAEAHSGVGRGHEIVFAIVLGSGVGGGLVIDGRLLNGFGGVSGEWGHGPIVDPGAGGLIDPLPRLVCGCGRTGCLDPVGSARGLERLHLALTGISMSSEQIIGAWGRSEPGIARTVEVFVENIARVLAVIINTVGASIVPVGGGLSSATDLIAAIDRRVRDFTLTNYPNPVVVPGRHTLNGGLIGAALAGAAMEAVA